MHLQLSGWRIFKKNKRKVYKNQKVSEIKYKIQTWNCNQLIITIFPTIYIILYILYI